MAKGVVRPFFEKYKLLVEVGRNIGHWKAIAISCKRLVAHPVTVQVSPTHILTHRCGLTGDKVHLFLSLDECEATHVRDLNQTRPQFQTPG
jgi:hypothetical protein